jgi:hypothetical protein
MSYPTFKQQYDKLTSAYIANKVNPWNDCACFVGNLLNGNSNWHKARHLEPGEYVPKDVSICLREEAGNLYHFTHIINMEKIFLDEVNSGTYPNAGYLSPNYYPNGVCIEEAEPKNQHPNYENALWSAFVKTLDYLKQVHIESGEDVDGEFEFKKRDLNEKATCDRVEELATTTV